MEIGVLVAVITVLIAIIGWLLTTVQRQGQIIHTQRESIDSLSRQVDHAKMIDEVTVKILQSLPNQSRPGGTS